MSRPKVFVIDDDPDTRDALLDILRGEGYDALGARDALAALTLMTWQRYTPDLIIVDLQMPAMTGAQFVEVLAKHPKWKQIPVLVSTGDASQLDGASHLVAGVLEKPLELDRTLEVVRSLIAKA